MTFPKRDIKQGPGGLSIEMALDELITLHFGDVKAEVIFSNIKGSRIKLCIKAPREVLVKRSAYRAREGRPEGLPRA